jgi:SAM-dependent methyltransferase
MAQKKHRRPRARRGKHKGGLAAESDRYELYLASVQAPDVDVRFFNRVFKENFARPAKTLREDFCGTAAVCCEWVKAKKDRIAYGIDLDPEPLAWGREHNLASLKARQQERVFLVEGDVRTARTPPVDIIAAQNFSYCIFKDRTGLRRYFSHARRGLADEGVFILDLFGGYESIEDDREESTDFGDFEYVWEQHQYDPITAHGTYKIHFRFPDGSALEDAFVYDWRLWTIPEVAEVLLEAGFDRADVYWEDTDPKSGDGNGYYRVAEQGACDPAWNAYIVGIKEPDGA